jgi:hypothetical protein
MTVKQPATPGTHSQRAPIPYRFGVGNAIVIYGTGFSKRGGAIAREGTHADERPSGLTTSSSLLQEDAC